MSERKYEVGQHIVYFDEFGKPHVAIVTIWWGSTPSAACNLVFVSGDERKKDECGRQIERATSVVPRANQSAQGRFWCWPDEV